MKKRLLMLALFVMVFVAILTISASAKVYGESQIYYFDCDASELQNMTVDKAIFYAKRDSSDIITEYSGSFAKTTEKGAALSWYKTGDYTAKTGVVYVSVKSFETLDPAYANRPSDGRYLFQDASGVTKQNIVSINFPNNAGIKSFSNGSAYGFYANTGDYTPANTELLFAYFPNTFVESSRIVQATTVLEVYFDKDCQMTTIGALSFHGAESLRRVNIPKNVTIIESTGSSNHGIPFYKCKSLETLIFDEGSQLAKIQGGAFNGAKVGTLRIPSSMTTLTDNMFSNMAGLEVLIFPEGFTHFVNLKADGTPRDDHHSLTYNSSTLREVYLPATFYATASATKYKLSYVFAGGNHVKFFYCGTVEMFNKAKQNFKDSATNTSSNGNFLDATVITYSEYLENLKTNPTKYDTGDYVICGYNFCDAFYNKQHASVDDKDCTTAEKCTRTQCGLKLSDALPSHVNVESLTYANGFASAGLFRIACTNDGCEVKTDTVKEAIFTPKGYSTNPDKNAINGGYTVNLSSLAFYKEKVGDLKYGIVIANANAFGTNTFFNSENKVNTEKSLQVEIDSQYSIFDCEINFGANTGVEIDLVICAYVITENGVEFIQKDTGKDIAIGGTPFKGVTLAMVVALPVPPATTNEEN